MKQLTNISEYNDIVERYRQKGCLSNDYIQQEVADLISREALFADCNEKNAILYVKKDVGMRMYYYINDLEEEADLSAYNDIVTEILFRTDVPETQVEYLQKCGMQVNLIRDQYFGVYKDLQLETLVGNLRIEEAQTVAEVRMACELFNASFDKLSGDFIPEDMYQQLLNDKKILMAWDSDRKTFFGALHQTKEKGVNWISHVAVKSEARGHKIGPAMVEAFIQNNYADEKTRYMFWVQRQNAPAVKMYQRIGFKYMNKSTISLIK